MKLLKQYSTLLFFSLLYIGLASVLIYRHQEYFALGSLGLLALFAGIYYTEQTFISLGLLVPLSINIEEYVDGFGLFLPTEPMLFGFLVAIIILQMRRPFIPTYIWNHPIFLAAIFYLAWLFLSCITSTNLVASFKFLLARMWFMIPMLILGGIWFTKKKNIVWFLWLFVIGVSLVCVYTVLTHMQYNFGEKESHWVMWPFFKDHTIYGAIVAMAFVLSIGLYLSKKYPPLTQAVLLSIILVIGIGLYFSYTRAAWLSVVGAAGIALLIRLKIPFSYVAGVTLFLGIVLSLTWDNIQMELERNKTEHTTENFTERLQSATNVTTDASNLERLNRWSCAWEMFMEKPIMGFGPGTYAFEYARFQRPENLTIISTNFGDGGNAHSEYLGPLSETGVIGLLSVLILIGVLFYKGIVLYSNWPNEDHELKTLLLYMILALTTYFIHGLLNNYLDTDKAAVPIWGICGIFIALEQVRKRQIESK
jgi:putative inorganic carbon (hco3(-)) transporter